MKRITTPRRLSGESHVQTTRAGARAPELPSKFNSHASHNASAAKGKSRMVPIHGGCKPQSAGGLGHPTGAQPIDSGGAPVASGVHPFAKAPSPQLAHGKLAPVKDGMKNRTRGGNLTGDPADVLAHANPMHPQFRGKSVCGD